MSRAITTEARPVFAPHKALEGGDLIEDEGFEILDLFEIGDAGIIDVLDVGG